MLTLNSGQLNVLIQENGGTLLSIGSNTIINGNGVELVLKANNFDHYDIFQIVDSSNIIIDNITIIGDVEQHTGTAGEWGHALHILGGHNIRITNSEFDKCWGDGISIDSSKESTIGDLQYHSSDINVNSVKCLYNRRQGISIEGAVRVWVADSEFSYTGRLKRTAPSAGIDIEPWRVNDISQDIYINNCVVRDSVSGINVAAPLDKNRSKNIRIENCYCDSDEVILRGYDVHVENTTYTGLVNIYGGEIQFKGCTIETTIGLIEELAKIDIQECNFLYTDNSHSKYYGGQITLSTGSLDSIVTVSNSKFYIASDITNIWVTSGSISAVGNVTFNNSTIIDEREDWYSFILSGADFYDCYIKCSTITVQSGAGKMINVVGCTIDTPAANGKQVMFFSGLPSVETFLNFSNNIIVNPKEAFFYITDNSILRDKIIIFRDNNIPYEFVKSLYYYFVLCKQVIFTNQPSFSGRIYGDESQTPTLTYYQKGYPYFNEEYNLPFWWNGEFWLNPDGTFRNKVVFV